MPHSCYNRCSWVNFVWRVSPKCLVCICSSIRWIFTPLIPPNSAVSEFNTQQPHNDERKQHPPPDLCLPTCIEVSENMYNQSHPHLATQSKSCGAPFPPSCHVPSSKTAAEQLTARFLRHHGGTRQIDTWHAT